MLSTKKKIKIKKIDSRKFISAKLKMLGHLRKLFHKFRESLPSRKFLPLRYKYCECSSESKSVKDELIEYKRLCRYRNYQEMFNEN